MKMYRMRFWNLSAYLFSNGFKYKTAIVLFKNHNVQKSLLATVESY